MNLRSSSQLMGDLPPIRFQQIRPFESTGLDFAGPLTTKCAHKRSVTKFKSYICLFICTATKAVHLELVSILSTAAFLAALRRFIARRSCPSTIISDNGSNFKGASESSEKARGFMSARRKCSTLLIQIEACLNSRPLTELSPDPSDFTALTPAHFLVGGPIHQFPEPSQPSRSVGLSERWNLIQRLRQYFWDRWSTEYLHRLQPRSKWCRTKQNLQLGDMVIVEKEKTAPLNWTLGRINKLFFGPDQKVRVKTYQPAGCQEIAIKVSTPVLTRVIAEDHGIKQLDMKIKLIIINKQLRCDSEIQTTSNHDIGCRTSVAMHNTTVLTTSSQQQLLTTVSPNLNPNIVML
ncbi:integrase catalytic domain-containing protein [Trichonephila clavipes]|nr:integrase catalytic domain-containing protein [Trichonephila clavipes]